MQDVVEEATKRGELHCVCELGCVAGNGFDNVALFNSSDAAHCVKFCGFLWQQEEEKQNN